MGIDSFDVYFNKVKKVLDSVADFCASINTENRKSVSKGDTDTKLNAVVEKIKKTRPAKRIRMKPLRRKR